MWIILFLFSSPVNWRRPSGPSMGVEIILSQGMQLRQRQSGLGLLHFPRDLAWPGLACLPSSLLGTFSNSVGVSPLSVSLSLYVSFVGIVTTNHCQPLPATTALPAPTPYKTQSRMEIWAWPEVKFVTLAHLPSLSPCCHWGLILLSSNITIITSLPSHY